MKPFKLYKMDKMDITAREMSEKERSATDSLISLSETLSNEPEVFDRVVVTSSWEEVSCGWRNTNPNVCYISSPERRKKPKEKLQTSSTFTDPECQLAKVKKLAGMIANSNLVRDGSYSTKLKTIRNSALAKYQNCGVLSYDIPCWRFVSDPKQYRYVERLALSDLRALNDRRASFAHTILLENGAMITCQEVNGRMALFDPALSFDKHLLETYEDREEYRMQTCRREPCTFDYATAFSQTRTIDNRIRVLQTLTMKKNHAPCNSLCKMCRHRTQELGKNDLKILSSSSSECELKPLQKITPTQRRLAEDSKIAGRDLMQHSRPKESVRMSKKSMKEGNGFHSRHNGMKLDWLPITRSTIAYPYMETMTGNERVSNGKFPDRPSPNSYKTFSFPRNQSKARKLTLSEAANLVPKASRLVHALDKLSKELEHKHDKPLSLSEPLLPAVSGTKLEVSMSGGFDS